MGYDYFLSFWISKMISSLPSCPVWLGMELKFEYHFLSEFWNLLNCSRVHCFSWKVCAHSDCCSFECDFFFFLKNLRTFISQFFWWFSIKSVLLHSLFWALGRQTFYILRFVTFSSEFFPLIVSFSLFSLFLEILYIWIHPLIFYVFSFLFHSFFTLSISVRFFSTSSFTL